MSERTGIAVVRMTRKGVQIEHTVGVAEPDNYQSVAEHVTKWMPDWEVESIGFLWDEDTVVASSCKEPQCH